MIRNFPNEGSAERLIGAVLMEIDEAWTSGQRYFDMDEYWNWRRLEAGKGGKGSAAPMTEAACRSYVNLPYSGAS